MIQRLIRITCDSCRHTQEFDQKATASAFPPGWNALWYNLSSPDPGIDHPGWRSYVLCDDCMYAITGGATSGVVMLRNPEATP